LVSTEVEADHGKIINNILKLLKAWYQQVYTFSGSSVAKIVKKAQSQIAR
jgi:hypothetical protein